VIETLSHDATGHRNSPEVIPFKNKGRMVYFRGESAFSRKRRENVFQLLNEG
jgi:hypothetical protein